MKVVFELTPAAPPATAARLSTSSTRPTPGTEPSSLASPASEATPVTVPIVSKKSVSMIAKITRTAVSRGSVEKTLPMSKAPIVEKLSADVRAIVGSDAFLERVKNLGINAYGNTPAELRAWMTKEMARWKDVAQASNIKAD